MVAVFEEAAGLAIAQGQRRGSVPGEFQQAAALGLVVAADGARAQQVAHAHGAAGGGMVHQLLERRPVHVAEIAVADGDGRAHGRRLQINLKAHVIVLQSALAQIGQGGGLLRRGGRAEGLQRLLRHHPGGDRCGEGLGEEGAEGLVFPGLNIAGAPVVEQHEAEDQPLGAGLIEHLAHGRILTDDETHLQFEIELGAGAHDRGGVADLELAQRTAHRRAAHHHRAGAAVVADGHVPPVGHERRVGAAQDHARIGGVLQGRIEIAESGDREGQMQGRPPHGDQRARPQASVIPQPRRIGLKQGADAGAGGGPDIRAQRHEGVQGLGLEDPCGRLRQQSGPGDFGQIKDEAADGDAHPLARVISRKDAIGQVLDGEVAVGRHLDEGAQLGIVGVHGRDSWPQGRVGSKCFFRPVQHWK